MIIRLMPADRTGCGFYRMSEPGRVVANQASGVEIEYCYRDDEELQLEVGLHGRLGDERVVEVADPKCDVIVLQRPADRHLAEAIPHIQAHGTAVVVEIDDDFDSVDPRNAAWRAYDPASSPQSNKVWLRLATELADLVTVTTPALAKRYGAHGRVRVIPNYVPAWYLDVSAVKPADGRLRFGWTGNVRTHPGDLQVMDRAVSQLAADDDHVFRVIGGETALRICGVDDARFGSEHVNYVPLYEYPTALASLHVGLVPLKDSPFNRAKSWLKGLEFAAVGVPSVASPTAPYRSLSELGIGDVVSTTTRSTSAWYRAILRLLEDDEYRRLRAEESRLVASTLTYEQHAEEWCRAWTDALSLRRAA